jgi:hypothetical protein
MFLDISFKPRTSIKSQALADFVAEWTECQEDMPTEKTSIGQCILMGRRGFQVLEQELF